MKNAVAFSQAESQRPAERCELFHCSVYKAKLLAHLRAVLSDKSLKPHSGIKRGQPPEHCLGTKGYSEKRLRCQGGVTF